MMAAKNKAGASAPAETYQVRGIEFTVNSDFMASWAALKMLRKFNEDGLGDFEKLDLSIELIRLATGLGEDDIVEAAGGDMAKATDVIALAMEIVTTIAPKNS